MKDIVILGGPNGAGKTTAAQFLIPRRLSIREFVNADEIARGMSPLNPEGAAMAAGRVMITRMRDLVRRNESFAFETTCAGRSHIDLLRRCKSDGWRITLIFLWLASPEAAVQRVARRVQAGGHSIPREVVMRRYALGLANMRDHYLPIADMAAIYDNSDKDIFLIAERSGDRPLIILDAEKWRTVMGAI